MILKKKKTWENLCSICGTELIFWIDRGILKWIKKLVIGQGEGIVGYGFGAARTHARTHTWAHTIDVNIIHSVEIKAS